MARKNTIFAFLLGAIVTAGGTGLYLTQIGPDNLEQPLGLQDLFPETLPPSDSPSQAGLDDVPTMITRLAQRLEQNPSNPDGWRMLGWSYMATDQAQKAAKAYAQAMELKGDVAQYRSAYGEALVKVASGKVTPDAKAAFDSALAIDSDDAQARYFVGLWKKQNGDAAGAYEVWATLLKDAPRNAPFLDDLRTDMASLARDLGRDAPAGASSHGPAAPVTASAETGTIIPDGQMSQIDGMVAGLAQRLKDSPDDADGWGMLGKSYGVLGKYEESIQAYARLVALRPDDPSTHRRYVEAVLNTVTGGEPYPASLSEPLNWLYRSNPKDEFALFHLGESSSRAGNREMAVKYWQSLLDVLPKNSSERATVGLKLRTLTENRTR